MDFQNTEYEQRIVAFIDILGFREIIKQSENDKTKIQLLYQVLEYLKNWEKNGKWDLQLIAIEEDAQKKGISNFDIKGRTNSTSFSDSIVVSVKINNNVNEMASTLIANLAYIGTILLEKGILFRGGLTIGNIIHAENGIVFGQALIDAYLLESKSAKFPRIVLSDKILRQLNYPLDSKRDRYPYHQYLQRFDDGCVGFHQIKYYQVVESWYEEITIDKLKTGLDKIRKVIVVGLNGSFESPDVFAKYAWLKDQYNKLIILQDYDIETKTEGHVKPRIRSLDEDLSGYNIHFK